MTTNLTSIIVDDEEHNIDVLEKMIVKFTTGMTVVGTAGTIEESKALIAEKKPDVVFLDIELSGENGFELIDTLEEVNFHVIFTTAHADYAIKAIKFAALDYLLKPISIHELREAIEKARIQIEYGKKRKEEAQEVQTYTNGVEASSNPGRIAIPTSEGLELFELEDIIKVEADRAYCTFYQSNGKKITVSKSLKEFEETLEKAGFIRVHKSYMVNLKHVKKYLRGKGGDLLMSDGSLVNIAVRKKDSVLNLLRQR